MCDAKAVSMVTTSGDIEGSFLSDKIFSVETVSGDIDVPYSKEGGECKIKTTSGDVCIKISPA